MAVYCISDIHGKIEAFKKMLEYINFKYDGSDTLYILGDMIDWDKNSIDTLLFCKEMQTKYPFIHILMGNHEEMFKHDTEKYTVGGIEYLLDRGHFSANRQDDTMRKFIGLDENTRNDIMTWVSSLGYYKEIEVNNRSFYLTHSYVFRDKRDSHSNEYRNHHERMVWERVKRGDNPIKEVKDNDKTILVHGHTIVSEYESYNDEGKLSIYKDLSNQRIAIDCGAKVLGQRHMARLSCIRLDDLEEFYIWKSNDKYIRE